MSEHITPIDYAREEDNPLNRESFLAIASQAYGWTTAWDGELHGLVAGDMGYEGTGVNLGVLVAHAMAETGHGDPKCIALEDKLSELISMCREVLSL